MILPQRMALADPATDVPTALPFESLEGVNRGPANAIIARLAEAIAEQNAANATDTGVSYNPAHARHLHWFLALSVGSASLWGAAILIGRALF